MTTAQEKGKTISRRKYLKYIGAGVVVVAAAAIGGYYLAAPPAPAPKKYKWGLLPYYMDDDASRVVAIGAQYYAEDRGYDFVVQNPHGSIETQITQIRNMVTGDKIDGLIVTPCDLVVIVDTLKWVKERGVPIVATQYDVDTDAVDLSVIADFTLVGRGMAEQMINAAQQDGARVEGPVFIVTGPSEDYQSKTLTEAEQGFLKDYPDLEPIVLECPTWGTDEAIKNVVDGYHGYGRPFGIFANNMSTSIGVVEGMKTAGIAVTRGNPDHVYASTFDGAAAIWDYMEAGFVDCFADIPYPHLESMAQDFLAVIKEKGVDALPPIGMKVISDKSKDEGPQPDGTWNLLLHGKEHKGVNPWDVPVWAPAEMSSHMGLHRRLNVTSSVVTPDKLPYYKSISWVSLAEAWIG